MLAIQYGGIRHTRDIDFSTSDKVKRFDKSNFLGELCKTLALAVETLEYGLDCRVQSHEMKPPSPEATMPTLKIRIGYAYKHDSKTHKRLKNKQSVDVVEVDYSFNEPNFEHTNVITLSNGGAISVYNIVDVVAEKIRAMLQQETRNRVRRQDAYDLFCLFSQGLVNTNEEKEKILQSLKLKSKARNMSIDRETILHEDIRKRSELEYPKLEQEIDGTLPNFQDVYTCVTKYYQSLPW